MWLDFVLAYPTIEELVTHPRGHWEFNFGNLDEFLIFFFLISYVHFYKIKFNQIAFGFHDLYKHF